MESDPQKRHWVLETSSEVLVFFFNRNIEDFAASILQSQ